MEGRDKQSIPHYSVCPLFAPSTWLKQWDKYPRSNRVNNVERVPTFWTPTLSFMLSLIWDRSNEAHPSFSFSSASPEPLNGQVKSDLHLLQWTFKVKPSCVSPHCLAIECAVWYSLIVWLLHMHLLAYMLCIYHHHQLPLMHDHLICFLWCYHCCLPIEDNCKSIALAFAPMIWKDRV